MRPVLIPFFALVSALFVACSEGTPLAPTDARSTSDSATMDAVVATDVPSLDVSSSMDAIAADSSDDGSAADASAGDGSEAGCTSTVAMPPYSDRTMNEEFTDPPTCAGCPSPYADLEELSIATLPDGATSLRVAGTARGATQCEWFVSNSSCGHTGGRILTDPEGNGPFSTTLPVFCGTNVVRIVCRNDRGARVLVRRIEGPRCSGRDLRVTLAWDMPGLDLELHLLRAPRALNSMTDDCTWFTCMSPAGLEWGAAGDTDNPRKDIDNTGSFGPENIYLDRAPAGTYYVMVEHWSRSGEPSTADVDIIVRERSVARLRRMMFPRQWVWNVGTITFPEGRFTPTDTATDCNAAWMMSSRGCDMPLP